MAKAYFWQQAERIQELQAELDEERRLHQATQEKLTKLARTCLTEREAHRTQVGGLRDQILNLERQTEYLRATADRERHLSERATEAYTNLVNLTVEMKREGFVLSPHSPSGPLETIDFTVPDQITGAIEQAAGDDKSLYRQLTKWAMAELRSQGKDADILAIAKRIRVGGTGEETDDD